MTTVCYYDKPGPKCPCKLCCVSFASAKGQSAPKAPPNNSLRISRGRWTMSTRDLFGTDGIRGRANEDIMTAEVALRVGRAVAFMVREHMPPQLMVRGRRYAASASLKTVSGYCRLAAAVHSCWCGTDSKALTRSRRAWAYT